MRYSLDYLSKRYHLIGLPEFIRAHAGGLLRRLPRWTMVLTFDDGHVGNYQLLDQFRQLGVPVTIFLCSELVGTNRHFWFKHVAAGPAVEAMKRLPNTERLDVLAEQGFSPAREYDRPQALSHAQVAEMSPCVDFQAHTLDHPCLPTCDDGEIARQLTGCKLQLERDHQLPITTISYPNGDYDERTLLLARQAGYRYGITVKYGYNTSHTDPLRLKRMDVNDTEDVNELAVKASGLWHWLKSRRSGNKQTIAPTAVTAEMASL